MANKLGLTLASATLAVGLIGLAQPASAVEYSAMNLGFTPDEEADTRYMLQLMLAGEHVSPGIKDELGWGGYMIGTVYKDSITDALQGQTRHRLHFYNYNVMTNQRFGQDHKDSRFGGNPFPELPGGGGGGEGGGGEGGGGEGGGGEGGGGGGSMSMPGKGFVGGLGLPPGSPDPMQGEGGGGEGGRRRREGGDGGAAGGQPETAVQLNNILVNDIDYITNGHGEVLDIGGLDLMREISQNQLVRDPDAEAAYIDINISHLFEWTHLLYLPADFQKVYKEDIWFHTFPIHVPGLPVDQPVMTKFTYKLIDFRNVGTRKCAVIDMTGVCDWNHEWETTTRELLTEFKSWGSMGFSARFWFDYEKNVLFAITRPPFMDWQYMRYYGGVQDFSIPYAGTGYNYTMTHPGMAISTEMFYNTRVTDISGKPKLTEVKPKENRRYISTTMLLQLEAE